MEDVYKQAIEKYGQSLQIVVAIEELAELQQAISKFIRGKDHNVEEEIADVKIMIKQLEIIFDKEKVDEWEQMKLKRLEERIRE